MKGFIMSLMLFSNIQVPLAKDFGVQGAVFEIAEQDIIEVIQNNAQKIDPEMLKEQAIKSVKTPKALNLNRSIEAKTFFYDPSFVVEKNEFDANGKLIVMKGQKINPLATRSLSKKLVFLNGADDQQIKFVSKLDLNNAKVILTGGSPEEVSKDLGGITVFFDQGGKITEKLGINAVPSIVSQEGQMLKIEEVYIDDKN